MTVYSLGKEPVFPPPEDSEPDGILAVGGDLSPERLVSAYMNGIFPWYSSDTPIIWWSPDPRFVVYPEEINVSRSMRQVLKRKTFDVRFDTSFSEVIRACGGKRRKDGGTWITRDMIDAYIELHRLGIAHSVEAWMDGKLAGGLYGVSIGGIFFGESMFSHVSNASKAAFIVLAANLGKLGFDLIDCQVYTEHLESLGAFEMERAEFLDIVKKSVQRETLAGKWCEDPRFSCEPF